jgi:hypothetical protein
MKKELVNTILEREFNELSSNERIALNEYCTSEEEYEQLKMVFLSVESLKKSETIQPRFETKNSLDDIFAQKHGQKPRAIWYNSALVVLYPTEKTFVKRPLVQIAALALLLLLAFPIVNSTKVQDQSESQLAEVKFKKQDAKATTAKSSSPESSSALAEPAPEPTVQTRSIDMEPLSEDMMVAAPEMSYEAYPSEPEAVYAAVPILSERPDGIYTGSSIVTFSQAASAQPQVFDLLTTTF